MQPQAQQQKTMTHPHRDKALHHREKVLYHWSKVSFHRATLGGVDKCKTKEYPKIHNAISSPEAIGNQLNIFSPPPTPPTPLTSCLLHQLKPP